MDVFDVKCGNSPLILAFPHTGTFIPENIHHNLNEKGQILADTDWYVDRLYDGLVDDVTTVRALFHRYVIDANRDPADVSLYPGQNTTSLVPVTDFDGCPIWFENPDSAEIEQRKELYHAPYHASLQAEIDRVKEMHGFAVLYDCHSIRSHIPFLFEEKLPDFNVGTNSGKTTIPSMEQAVLNVLVKAAGYDHVLNGRFKGGWTTRHYGDPENNIYAIQMELAQSTYLEKEKPPFAYDSEKATALQIHLKEILEAILADVKTYSNNGR
ncbi:N-formylglutamate deformylase [Bartonella sp. CB169]|uniref:N-formylglutamate deformylase n=1 Tax=Bartonella sp. CB169 TaxID=3112257 RepID=UPI00300DFB01